MEQTIQINPVELASHLAASRIDELYHSNEIPFPYVDDNEDTDVTCYTEEGQKTFDKWYDWYYTVVTGHELINPKTTVLPEKQIILNSKDPKTQDIIISMFKAMGLPVYKNTNCFNPTYPYIIWDGAKLVQTRYNNQKSHQAIFAHTMEKFMSYFVITGDVHIVNT